MKIVFAGTPVYAATALQALLDAGHDLRLVLTQPDRPAGRGLKPQASAVKQLAGQRNVRILQPTTLRDPDVAGEISAAAAEVIVVAAYGLLFPESLLKLPPLGCINIHASLLPRWRGAAPIQHAVLAGDTQTGVTIMQMEKGLDTGPILLQESTPIDGSDTAGTLHDKLARIGARLIVRALIDRPAPRPQDPALATYAPRIGKLEPEIDWTRPAVEVARQVRAFNPSPGAYTRRGGDILKIWTASVEPTVQGPPGSVCSAAADGILIACGSGALRVMELQRSGARRLAAAPFLAGSKLEPGMRLGESGD